MGAMIRLRATDDHELGAYEARPAADCKGGIVLVQEIYGVNPHIRSVADSFAAEGYHVVAPALFDRFKRDIELRYGGIDNVEAFALMNLLRQDSALNDIGAAYKHLAQDEASIAVAGFCYGGLMSWLSATRGADFGMAPKCTVGYYAGGIGKVAEEQPLCPVMLHFGADDDHIGADQREKVHEAHPEVQIFVYEGAGHAFNRDADPTVYREAAARLARQRTLAFLADNLR